MTIVSWRELKLFFLYSYKHYNWTNERFSSAESEIKTNYKFLILFTDKKGYTS